MEKIIGSRLESLLLLIPILMTPCKHVTPKTSARDATKHLRNLHFLKSKKRLKPRPFGPQKTIHLNSNHFIFTYILAVALFLGVYQKSVCFWTRPLWIDISCKFWDFLRPSNKLCIKILETYVQCSWFPSWAQLFWNQKIDMQKKKSYIPWK